MKKIFFQLSLVFFFASIFFFSKVAPALAAIDNCASIGVTVDPKWQLVTGNSGTHLFTVTDTNQKLDPTHKYFIKIYTGEDALATMEYQSDASVSPVVDSTTNTAKLTFTITNQTILSPNTPDYKHYVYIVDDGFVNSYLCEIGQFAAQAATTAQCGELFSSTDSTVSCTCGHQEVANSTQTCCGWADGIKCLAAPPATNVAMPATACGVVQGTQCISNSVTYNSGFVKCSNDTKICGGSASTCDTTCAKKTAPATANCGSTSTDSTGVSYCKIGSNPEVVISNSNNVFLCSQDVSKCCQADASCPGISPATTVTLSCGQTTTNPDGVCTCSASNPNKKVGSMGSTYCCGYIANNQCYSTPQTGTGGGGGTGGTGGGTPSTPPTSTPPSFNIFQNGPTPNDFNDLNPFKMFSKDPDAIAAASSPAGLISRILLFAFPLAGLILFVMLVWAGFEIILGAAGSKSIDAGKQRATAAIIGFILLFVSYWIMQVVEVIFGVKFL